MPRWLPITLFGCLLVLFAGLLMPDVWHMRKLYLDKSIRNTVRVDMNQISARTGWLLSDMILRDVGENTVTFLLHYHLHGRDPSARCFILYFPTSRVDPCNEG